jgi:single-stranded DNA-specific DHH superfamily exonuclease
MAELIESLASSATRLGEMAYFEAPAGTPIGTVAGLITDALGVDVGLSYTKKGGSLVNISIRSRRGLLFHLGEITRRIAKAQGGFGGGHKRASGASLPLEGLEGFIVSLEEELSRYSIENR